jgi:hypothetical protein
MIFATENKNGNILAEVRHGIVVKSAKSFGISSSGRVDLFTTFGQVVR